MTIKELYNIAVSCNIEDFDVKDIIEEMTEVVRHENEGDLK